MNEKRANSLVDNFLNKKTEQELEEKVCGFLRKGFAANFRRWINGDEDLCAENMVKHTNDRDLVAGNDALAQLNDFQKNKKLPKKDKK